MFRLWKKYRDRGGRHPTGIRKAFAFWVVQKHLGSERRILCYSMQRVHEEILLNFIAMLQIINESQSLTLKVGNEMAFADFILEDGEYLNAAVDLRYYDGPLAKWAKGLEVVYCTPEEIYKIFDENSEPGVYRRLGWSWEDYCRFVNQNLITS